jgi:hypothetical protein
MTTRVIITPNDFFASFHAAIRVGFNWQRFFEESWPIEPVTLRSPADLARCFMPWYIGRAGNEVAYDDPHAVPMRVTDVPKGMHILNDERRADIQQYVDSFGRQDGVVEFAAPAYALPDDHYFVLDRNHRLSALTLVSVPFAVTLWNVRGPLDRQCLLDLIHWEPKS